MRKRHIQAAWMLSQFPSPPPPLLATFISCPYIVRSQAAKLKLCRSGHNKFGYVANYSRETLEWINLTAAPPATSAGSGDLVCATVLTQLVASLGSLWLCATPTRQQRALSGRHCMRLCSSISYKSHAFAPWRPCPLTPPTTMWTLMHAMCFCVSVCF